MHIQYIHVYDKDIVESFYEQSYLLLNTVSLYLYIKREMPLHSCDYLDKNSIKQTWRLTKAIAEMKCDTEQTMKLE